MHLGCYHIFSVFKDKLHRHSVHVGKMYNFTSSAYRYEIVAGNLAISVCLIFQLEDCFEYDECVGDVIGTYSEQYYDKIFWVTISG